MLNGASEADAWAADCHKWLNVPYDSGLAFVREAGHLRSAMALSGPIFSSVTSEMERNIPQKLPVERVPSKYGRR